jgi:hypothetical protein
MKVTFASCVCAIGAAGAAVVVGCHRGGPSSMPVHPGYCRRLCRKFTQRSLQMHARRVSHAARAGTGKCGGTLGDLAPRK